MDEVNERGAEHPAVVGAAMHSLMDTARGRNARVMMTYADALERLAAWFVQLWAESLGKDGKGSTAHGAVGTTDQHSQVQLFMQAPQDKTVEIVEVGEHRRDLPIPPAYTGPEGVGYLGGHAMAELLNVECDATRKALTEAERPNFTMKLGGTVEENLGYLFQALEVQPAVSGSLYGVNAFDQPGVEAGKNITYHRIGRPGYWGVQPSAISKRTPEGCPFVDATRRPHKVVFQSYLSGGAPPVGKETEDRVPMG